MTKEAIKIEWVQNSVFYHWYPLGALEAPHENHGQKAPRSLGDFHNWIPYMKELGINAVLFGPLWDSDHHGYDTRDLRRVDPRIGTNEELKTLCQRLKEEGFRILFDGVFNHVGRGFWAFEDLRQKGSSSPYADWFAGVDFSRSNPAGDPFDYETWEGHYALVKLNLQNPAVKEYLLESARFWIEEFGIDGIRLDAADQVSVDFWQDLNRLVKSYSLDFWLMGEIIHGDYTHWAQAGVLDSVTNYEAYKGLWSSFNDKNFFEIAWTFQRQFDGESLYDHLDLMTFLDNHDVNRVASTIENPAHLFPAFLLQMTMPGVPCLYYGSEKGLPGVKGRDDWPLRPALTAHDIRNQGRQDLFQAIQRMIQVRKEVRDLRQGALKLVFTAHQQLAFSRGEGTLIMINADESVQHIPLEAQESYILVDKLNPAFRFEVRPGMNQVPVDPCWGRILQPE